MKSAVVLLTILALSAGCFGGSTKAITASTTSQAVVDLENLDVDEEPADPVPTSPPAPIGPVFPTDFLLQAAALPFEMNLSKVSRYAGQHIGQASNPGRVDGVMASTFLRPVATEAWWEVVERRSASASFLTIQVLKWPSPADAIAGLGRIGMTDGKCHVGGSPADPIRGVFRNESIGVLLGFEPQEADYAQLLLDALRKQVDLLEVCPIRYASDPDPSTADSAPAVFWTDLEATDKVQVVQPPNNGNWSHLTVGSNLDVVVRVNGGPAVRVPSHYDVPLSGAKITTNDALELCIEDPAANVRLYLYNQGILVHAHTFLVVDQKPWC